MEIAQPFLCIYTQAKYNKIHILHINANKLKRVMPQKT